MPHDVHGSKIAVGDYILTKPYNRAETVVGIVVQISEAQTCTGQIVWPAIGGVDRDYFGAETSELILRRNGSRPPFRADVPQLHFGAPINLAGAGGEVATEGTGTARRA